MVLLASTCGALTLTNSQTVDNTKHIVGFSLYLRVLKGSAHTNSRIAD